MFSRAFLPSMRARAIGAAAAAVAAATYAAQPTTTRVAWAQAKQQAQTVHAAVAVPASASAAASSSFALATALALSADGRCSAQAPQHTHSASCTLLPSAPAVPAVPSSSPAESAAAAFEMTPGQQVSCEEFKSKAIASSRKINYIFRAMKKSGCEVDPLTFIQCTACGPHMSGALMHAPSGEFATLMCGNRLHSFRAFETVLAHELIHAYDMCRAEIDVLDLRHHACMEIRAASLSGDCTYRNEAAIGYVAEITGHHDKCVKRKATLSVLSNPSCGDAAQAKAAVEEVFDRCIKDTEPFGAIP